jgi:hypothetical protein
MKIKLILFLFILSINCKSNSNKSEVLKNKNFRTPLNIVFQNNSCAFLKKNLQQDPDSIDYLEFRYTCSKDKNYNPNYSNSKTREELFQLLEESKYDKVLTKLNDFFKADYSDITSHLIATIVYGKKEKEELVNFHNKVARGLINSILQSGDGSLQNPFYVISVKEEYNFLDAMNVHIEERLPSKYLEDEIIDIFEIEDNKSKTKMKVHFILINVKELYKR